MKHRILTAAALLAVLAAGAPAGEAVRTPRILREGQVDTSSMEAIIRGIIKPGMTQKQKALAVYEFALEHMYHWAPAREGPNPNSYDYGVVYDPVKLLNVYGYGYCFQNRAVAEALWEAAGLEARSAGIGGHSIAEVFYDGAWHFLDTDQQGYALLADGETIASIDQVCRDPVGLLLKQPRPSEPFFPATRDPKVPYESKVISASYFASTRDNYYQHDKIVTGHRMDLKLLPGMRYVRRFTGDGRWSIKNSNVAFEYKLGYINPRGGPRDYIGGTGYATGELLYQPDLTTRSGEYRAGVWAQSNVKVTKKGLEPAEAGKAAWCVFRIRLPYVIAGWATAFKGPARPVGAAVLAATFTRKDEATEQEIAVSTDGGHTWTPVWTNDKTGKNRAVVDLSEHVVPKYEYLLRLKLTGGKGGAARLEKLALNTAFQVAPRSLPALKPGANRMTFSLGEETETLDLSPSLSNSDSFLRHMKSYKGIWFRKGQVTSKLGRQGEFVYELAPPKPGSVVRFSAGAGCRREPFGLNAADDIKIYYAENEPKDWKLVYDDDFPLYAKHWCYHANGGAKCTPGTKKVYVKFAIRTASSASIQRLRLKLHWKPAGAGGLPARGARVEHGWTEAGRAKVFAKVFKKAPARYTVKTGAEMVNTHVTIEPVRARGLAWRKDDPPVRKPETPKDKVLDEKLRDEMRSLLRAVDADPKTGLAKAAKSKIGWLAGGARQAQAMMRAKYPVRPKGPNPEANPLKDEAGRAAARKIMAGADSYAKMKLLGAVRASGVKPAPDVALEGLKDPSRNVRLEVVLLVRGAPSPAGIKALEKALREDPLEFLRAEAKSALAAIRKKKE